VSVFYTLKGVNAVLTRPTCRKQGSSFRTDLASFHDKLSAMQSNISLLSRSTYGLRREDFNSADGTRPGLAARFELV
jgi:hypothetical protein